jgi:cysteinyl-tRNA synthetase
MDDDLNAPKAMAAVFGLAGAAQRALSAAKLTQGSAALVRGFLEEIDDVLGILDEGGAGQETSIRNPELPERLARMVQERQQARRTEDWARSDALRDELVAAGVTVTDTPAGPAWTWTGSATP